MRKIEVYLNNLLEIVQKKKLMIRMDTRALLCRGLHEFYSEGKVNAQRLMGRAK
jgi:hypothetical protein